MAMKRRRFFELAGAAALGVAGSPALSGRGAGTRGRQADRGR